MLTRKPSLWLPLAAMLLLFGTGGASAFNITHTTNYDGFSELEVSDTVVVNVFLDTAGAGADSSGPAGLSVLSIGVIYTTPVFEYIPGGLSSPNPYAYLNAYYPPTYPSPTYQTPDNGSQSSYLLWSLPQPATGTFPGTSSYGYMIHNQTPWQTWPSPPSGFEQVQLIWNPTGAVPNLGQQTRASSNTWLGSILLHVRSQGQPSGEIGLLVDSTCCLVLTGDVVNHSATTVLDAPTVVLLPEPSVAVQFGFGLLGLRLLARRKTKLWRAQRNSGS